MTPIPTVALPPLTDWPRDEAAHEPKPWEIWWITAIVQAGDRHFAAHALFMHFAGGGLKVSATVTDLDRSEERTTSLHVHPGRAALSTDELRIHTELASFEGSFADGYRLTAELDGDDGYELLLKPTRPVLHNGGSGQFDFQGVTTSQYSIGFLETSGSIHLDGQELTVTGHGWYDRQWDHWAREGDVAFTWFGICLDNGDALSVFDTGTAADAGHRWATIVRPDGTHIVTAVEALPADIRQTRLGRAVPQRWSLSIPAMNARLEFGQQQITEADLIYTGAMAVEGSYESRPVTGYGFCDVVGKIAAPAASSM